MNFEDGRKRVITPISQNNGLDVLSVDGNIDLPGGKRGAYDYFIMDYLQNVRMILTEEVHLASNKATMESNRSTLEESIFGQTGSNNEVSTTRYAKPAGWTGNSSSQVSRLGTNSGHNIGPNALQKVMAGDKITATVLYYHEGSPGGNNTSMVNTLIGSLSPIISGSSGATGAVKSNASSITSQLGSVNGFINAVQPNGSNPSSSTPQAFLTILFFDERFNFIEAADGGAYQQQVAASVGSNGSTLTLLDKKAPKNGYVYVYVSNQSDNHVYFDDFNLAITQGNIVEENHYYSYGLKIAAISSRKFADSYEGLVKNNYLYQGAYSELDDDIGWNDFALRNYDPQIGRWVQQDPYQEFSSPYVGMGGNPIMLVDPSGGSILDGLSGLERVACSTLMGAIVGGAIGAISGDDDFTGVLIGAGVGAAGGLASLSGKIAAKMGLITLHQVSTIINTSITTTQIGKLSYGPSSSTNLAYEIAFSSDGYDYYKSADIAAFMWAKNEGYGRGNKDANERETEWSSIIFEKKDGKDSYYSYTKPAKLKTYLKRYNSPGPDAEKKYHGELPAGGKAIGFIHLHWEGSEALDKSNVEFSKPKGVREGDYGKMSEFPNLKFYVLGSTGILWGRIPLNTPPNNPRFPSDTDAGNIYRIAINVYGPGKMTNTIPMTKYELIPCKLQ